MEIEKQRPPSGWAIQTLILSKTKFNSKEAATSWVRAHKFKTSHAGKGPDETSTSWRFRQRDPGDFTSFRTINVTDGVSAVYGKLKKTAKAHGHVGLWDVIFNYIGVLK